MRLIGRVPADFQSDGIVWIVLEDDPDDTGGVYLFGHRSPLDECEFDFWYEDFVAAKRHAENDWGVQEADWKEGTS